MIGIYVRISDDDQSKYSISDQLTQCKIKAGTDEVMEYIDEGVTGSILERPALVRLRADVKSGLIDKVIVWDPDRFARDLMHQLVVANDLEKRAQLVFVNHNYQKTAEGIFFFQMRGAVSQYEKAKIAERTTRGRREKGNQGKVIKNSKMYGYDYDKINSTYIINEQEAAIVQYIFNLFTIPNTQVKGINGIAVRLSEHGVPTKKGAKVWHRQVVRQILLNPSYTGRYTQNKTNTEGMVGNKYRPEEDRVKPRERPEEEHQHVQIPRIISDYQFEVAQELIGISRRRYAKDALNPYLLSGLVRCGECENTMTGRKTTNWDRPVFEYTDEKNYSGAKFKGCRMHVACAELDRHVWEYVIKSLTNPDEVAAAEESIDETEQAEPVEIKYINDEIEKGRTKRKNLIKLFSAIEDEESQEAIRAEMVELSDREKQLTAKVAQLQEKANVTRNEEHARMRLQEVVDMYLTLDAENLTFEDQQNIIRAYVREVKVFRDGIKIYTF